MCSVNILELLLLTYISIHGILLFFFFFKHIYFLKFPFRCSQSMEITYICKMQVLLLMATALDVSIPEPSPSAAGDSLTRELRTRQQCIAEITEMIHVSSLEFQSLSNALVQYFADVGHLWIINSCMGDHKWYWVILNCFIEKQCQPMHTNLHLFWTLTWEF